MEAPTPAGRTASPAGGESTLIDRRSSVDTDRTRAVVDGRHLAGDRNGSPPDSAPAAGPPQPSPARAGRRLLVHLPFALLLLAGAVLRVLTWRAYRPALLFPDSRAYLMGALNETLQPSRPSGYSVFLWPFLELGGLATITLLQHLLGLAMAAAIYLLLLRLRVVAWLAALATAPLLLDSMQLVLEQYVMADTLFQALVLAACLLLLWRRRSSVPLMLAAGMALGLAATVRGAGFLLLAPAAVTALAVAGGWRRAVLLLAGLGLGFALPVGAYMAGFHHQHGQFALVNSTSRFLYSRLAPIADCRGLALPSYERSLCPPEPLDRRLPSNAYLWDVKRSPQYHLRPPAGMTEEQVLADFNRRIILHQPVRYAQLVGVDLLRGFQPFRTTRPGDVSVRPWLFHTSLPDTGVRDRAGLYRTFAGYGPVLDRPLASLLTGYQRLGHTPGPVLGVCAVVALLAAAGVGRARRSGLRVAAWTFAALCLVSLVTAAMSQGFSWRYQLVQLALLPPAGALGLTALTRRGSPDAHTGGPT
jgi:Dolichyl-phosphate-mannose-protein mannosyltransferase